MKNRRKRYNDPSFSYYKDNSTLITKEGHFIEDKGLYWNDDPILVEIESLYNERFIDLPADIGFFMEEPIRDSLFSICGFKCHKGKLQLELCSYQIDESWKTSVYNPKQIIERLKKLLCPEFLYIETAEEIYNIFFYYERTMEQYSTTEDFVQETTSKIRTRQRNVIAFIGPGELILQSTPYSIIEGITDSDVLTLSRKNLFNMLSNFAECRQLYRIFKKKHLDKIANYHNDIKNLTAGERYIEVLETYPRVKAHATKKDIASYLKISLADYVKICTVE